MVAELRENLFFALSFLMVPGCANMAPVFAQTLFPTWTTPLDLGIRFHGRKLLGNHKTFRGLVCGVLVGGLIYLLLAVWRRHFLSGHFPDPRAATNFPWWFGFWIGFCTLLGDAIKSFVKRRLGIQPGASWVPWDQTDWALGALAGAQPFIHFSANEVVLIIALAFFLSLFVRALGFLFSINRTPI